MELCLIIDFGSQYTQLIARKLRELGVRSEIVFPSITFEEIQKKKPLGIILSGGPSSVFERGAPTLSFSLEALSIPILGICYGMQLMAQQWKGQVLKGTAREYGVECIQFQGGKISHDFSNMKVLMSHGDYVSILPSEFKATAVSQNGIVAAMEHHSRPFFGFQFHPEVHHTERGIELLRKFLVICGFHFDWQPQHILEEIIQSLKNKIKKGRILCALSGGVDSSVVALILHKVFPGQVDCLCVDTGLLRKNEIQQLMTLFQEQFNFSVRCLNASVEFLKALQGVIDPETKRKIIGNLFIDIFERESRNLQNIVYLAQGTLYPDVIESESTRGGPSATIKSHHNVGGLPERLPFELIEPLRDLFKDEVRRLGEYLGLPHEFVWRHPFPGPGLAVRIVGEVTEEQLHLLREADARLQEVLKEWGGYEKLWQSFCVFLPIKSVGVMGDQRTYENVIAVRCVHSEDGMTAHIAALPVEVMEKISARIINEVSGVNRVVYDMSSKPPATIEWE